MRAIVIASRALSVSVLPDYGARVASLIDKRGGRDWIFPGGQSPNTGEDAVYSRDEAVGWDECFPTVGRYDAGAPWRRRLRDHGDLWGRPWRIDAQSATALTTSYVDPQFVFTRALWVDGPALVADYRARNLTGEPMPYLWAQHTLLTVSPKDHIVLGDAGQVSASFLSHRGRIVPGPRPFAWPGPDAGLPFPLDAVQPASALLMAKLLVRDIPSRSVALGHDGEWLTIGWDGLDDLGIWLAYGAWPSPGDLHHIALEPQTSFADHLGQTIESGAPPIAPHGSASWRTTMTVSAAR